jgi:hypothetical protein
VAKPVPLDEQQTKNKLRETPIAMKTKQSLLYMRLLLGAAGVSLLLGYNASGQFVVANGQNLTYDATVNLHTLDPSKTVIIESGGSMTVNARVNMNGQNSPPAAPPPCRLILNGGSFTQAVSGDIKFPDDFGPVEIWINAGTLNARGIQHLGHRADRGPAMIWLGGGELILGTGYGGGSNDYDPLRWVTFPNLVVGGVTYPNGLKALAGYELSFEDLGGGAVRISGVPSTNCASITLPASSLAVVGQAKSMTVSLTPGLNATQPTSVDIVSRNPAVAVPQGAVNGALTLTFPAGGHYTTNVSYNAVAAGSTMFYLTNANAAFCVTTTESLISVQSPGLTATKTESFANESSAAANGWVEVNSRANGQNFGFSNTGNASGSSGEAGGTFLRRVDRAYYADTNIGYLTLNDSISANGRAIVTLPSTDADFTIGYFNSADGPGSQNLLGINLAEGGGGVPAPNSRVQAVIGTAAATTETAALGFYPWDVYTWSFAYNPAGGPTGDGQLIVSFTNTWSFVETSVTNNLTSGSRAIGAVFNAFGLVMRGGSDREPIMEFYIDDLSYTKGFPLEEPQLLGIETGAGGATLKLNVASASGLPRVESTPALEAADWSPVSGVIFTSTGSNAWTAEFSKPADGARFYRLVVGQQ